MTKNILVAVDGSDNAERAVAVAADLAQKYDALLIAVHVMRDNARDGSLPELRDYEQLEHVEVSERSMLQSKADQILSHAEMRVRGTEGVRIETVLREGDAATDILKVAKDRGADLIVMGTRGLGTLTGLLVGSVSQKVCQLSACNCMIVK